MALSDRERELLRALAWQSLEHGLNTGGPWWPELDALPEPLTSPGAAFVTLQTLEGMLRGCIGSLEATRPLAEDVTVHAFNAAFRDPRFPPLAMTEVHELQLHISVLSAPVPLPAESETDLLGRLVPGIDGLTLEQGPYRATFLPTVWEQLPEPEAFLRALKRKAGLPASYWSVELRFQRYQTDSF